MTAPRGNQGSSRRRQSQRRNKTQDLWRHVAPPAHPDPIEPAPDPTALIDSLPPPPLAGHSGAGTHYMAAVVERAAAVATALAASAGMLGETEDD